MRFRIFSPVIVLEAQLVLSDLRYLEYPVHLWRLVHLCHPAHQPVLGCLAVPVGLLVRVSRSRLVRLGVHQYQATLAHREPQPGHQFQALRAVLSAQLVLVGL